MNSYLVQTRVLLLAVTISFASWPANAGNFSKSTYGKTAKGETVEQYTLESAKGVTVKFVSYGGIITEINVPDKNGEFANIVLGFSSLKDYEKLNGSIHFGSLIGRYANRIAGASFNLDGKTYSLPKNNGAHTLHGGPDSFDAKVWKVKPVKTKDAVGAELTYVSPDGENDFPGTLTYACHLHLNRRE